MGYEFVEITNVITGHLVKEEDYLMVVGFPGSRVKIDNVTNRVIAKPFLFKTKPFLKNLSKLNFLQELHFFAKYPRGKIIDSKTGKRTHGPKPHGISGSGLWLLRRDEHNQYNGFLIGVFSEYLENRALLVSTRIDIFIDIVRQKVDPTIPNKGVQVDFINY